MKTNKILIAGVLVVALIAAYFLFNVKKEDDEEPVVKNNNFPAATIKGAAPAPYNNDAVNGLYNLIFCDRTELVESKLKKPYPYPYSILFNVASAPDELHKVVTDPKSDTRVRIVAWNKLRERGMRNKTRIVLGVVIEIGMENGLDVLVAYDDLAARYINQSGKVLINEKTDDKSAALITRILQSADALVNDLQPTEVRSSFPEKGSVRLTLITTDGLCQTEGSPDAMFQGAKTAPVLRTCTELLQMLMANSVDAPKK